VYVVYVVVVVVIVVLGRLVRVKWTLVVVCMKSLPTTVT